MVGWAELGPFFGEVSPSAMTQAMEWSAAPRAGDRSWAKELQEWEAAVEKSNIKA